MCGCERTGAERELLFGTVETWLIWKLTKGAVHVTDYSNASRTMLFNINTLEWMRRSLQSWISPNVCCLNQNLQAVYTERQIYLTLADLSQLQVLPEISRLLYSDRPVSMQEKQKNTYGTGCFLLMNTGEKPIFSKNGLVTTIAWGLDGKVNYALEGSIFVAGAAIQWLRDELRIIESAADSEYMAKKVKDTTDVMWYLHLPDLAHRTGISMQEELL